MIRSDFLGRYTKPGGEDFQEETCHTSIHVRLLLSRHVVILAITSSPFGSKMVGANVSLTQLSNLILLKYGEDVLSSDSVPTLPCFSLIS